MNDKFMERRAAKLRHQLIIHGVHTVKAYYFLSFGSYSLTTFLFCLVRCTISVTQIKRKISTLGEGPIGLMDFSMIVKFR